MSSSEKVFRNSMLVEDYKAGIPVKVLAKWYGISQNRVRVILRRYYVNRHLTREQHVAPR